MRASVPFLAVLLCCAALGSQRALAQQGGEKLKLGAAMVLDFAGGVERDPGGRLNARQSHARVTPGVRLHADYDVHRYISVGGLLRVSFWRSDDEDSARNLLIDIAARVNGHYDWKDFRFYGVFLLGPTINRLNSENRAGLDNPGAGVAIGIAPGMEWWFARHFGLFSEIFGWSGHFFKHDYANAAGSTKFSINQVLWQIGVVAGF